MSKTILKLTGIKHSFTQGSKRLDVLQDINLSIASGEMVALVGQSGSGKSTLLQIMGLLARPNAGSIILNSVECATMSEHRRTIARRESIGFVYQFHHLLPEFSAVENVMMPQLIAGESKLDARERAKQLLDRMGLAERENHRPSELSGGEQQRVAIARALANFPSLVLADEPTGNLDPNTSDRIFEVLVEAIKHSGSGALIATHNIELANKMDKIIHLEDGRLR